MQAAQTSNAIEAASQEIRKIQDQALLKFQTYKQKVTNKVRRTIFANNTDVKPSRSGRRLSCIDYSAFKNNTSIKKFDR